MRRRPSPLVIVVLTLVGAAALLSVVVWPQGIGAEGSAPFVWGAALRAPLLVALVAAAIVAIVVAWCRPRRRMVLLPIAAALILAALVDGAVLVSRGWDPPAREASGTAGTDDTETETVRILSWNTEHAASGATSIAAVIADARADIVMLPETDATATAEVSDELIARGHRVAHDTLDQAGFPGSVPTSVMFLDAFADAQYARLEEAGSTPGQPSGLWTSETPGSPVVGAVHTVPPMPWALPLWSAGLDWVATACTDPHAIVAGDLNATVDHMAGLGIDGADIGRCRDVALLESAAARGTWPSDAPEWWAAPIDHILIGPAWRVVSFDVLEIRISPGSDHRPIVAELEPTG